MIFYCIICLYRPFERKSKENEVLLKHLQYFPEIAEQVSRHVLKELCSVAQLDKCPEEDYTGQEHIPVDVKTLDVQDY